MAPLRKQADLKKLASATIAGGVKKSHGFDIPNGRGTLNEKTQRRRIRQSILAPRLEGLLSLPNNEGDITDTEPTKPSTPRPEKSGNSDIEVDVSIPAEVEKELKDDINYQPEEPNHYARAFEEEEALYVTAVVESVDLVKKDSYNNIAEEPVERPIMKKQPKSKSRPKKDTNERFTGKITKKARAPKTAASKAKTTTAMKFRSLEIQEAMYDFASTRFKGDLQVAIDAALLCANHAGRKTINMGDVRMARFMAVAAGK